MANDYPSTAVPFENYALPDLHDPIVNGPGFSGLEGAAEVYTKLAETLDKAAGDLRAVMTASLGIHEGEAADAARQHINKVATAGDTGAAQARLATLALQEQASYYFRARLDMKAAAEAATGPQDEAARIRAIDAARLYQANSNHNLSNVFQVFDPPKTAAPDVSVGPTPSGPGWAQPAGGVPTISTSTAGAPGSTVAAPPGTPALVPPVAGDPSVVSPSVAAAAPGGSRVGTVPPGGSPTVTMPPGAVPVPSGPAGRAPNANTPTSPSPFGAVPSSPAGLAPGTNARTTPSPPGAVPTTPSATRPGTDSLGRLPGDPGYAPRVPTEPGVPGRQSPNPGTKVGDGPGWTPGQPWSTSRATRVPEQPGTLGPGAVPPHRPIGTGTGNPVVEPRPAPGRAPTGAIAEPIPTGSAGTPRGAAANQHGMPFMPMAGAGMGRQDGTHPRPPWLLDPDPEQTWMSNLPAHTIGVIEPLED